MEEAGLLQLPTVQLGKLRPREAEQRHVTLTPRLALSSPFHCRCGSSALPGGSVTVSCLPQGRHFYGGVCGRPVADAPVLPPLGRFGL